MQSKAATSLFTVTLAALTQAGCADDDSSTSRLPYDRNTTVVIGGEDGDLGVVHTTPSGNSCIDLDGVLCLQPQRECGEGAYADVLLDASGQVIETVCLPVEDSVGLVDVQDGVAVVPDNGAVVILGGPTTSGDISVEGNRATLYGDDPARVVIDGNLDLRGNSATVRGVTITGDVTFQGNDAQLYYCVVHGDVILRGNENLVTNCTIFGSVRSSGNEDRIVSNYVDGTIDVGGAPEECRDNQAFQDTNDNLSLDPSERDDAEPLACKKG